MTKKICVLQVWNAADDYDAVAVRGFIARHSN